MTVLVEMSKLLFGERFCRIKLLLEILSLVSVVKEKFPNFGIEGFKSNVGIEGFKSNVGIEGFKSNEICDATKHLPEHYEKHSKHLHSTQKFHHVTTEQNNLLVAS